MRRVLNQAANAAVKAKGTIFAVVYRRLVPRLGRAQAIGATHRLCRLIWKILHERVRYEERGAGPQRGSPEGARAQDDPRTPRPRLSRRARGTFFAGLSDFRPWLQLGP